MFAVLCLPHFPLQSVLRHEPELWGRPVVLVDPAQATPAVCDLTESALAAGITIGSTPTQAMARCRPVIIRPRSLPQERAAMTALLQCAYAFSPHLEATAAGVCTLDLRGLSVLAGAGRRDFLSWAERVRQSLTRVNLTASVGLAANPNLARHAARWGKGIELVEAGAPFMASLPIAALEPSLEVAHILRVWGLRTVGELVALGPEALAARLGLDALSLLAAASSTTSRPLHLVQPPPRFEEAFEFEHEVETVQPLLFFLRRCLDQISSRLEWHGLVAELLVLQLGLESGQQLVSRLRIPQPTRNPGVLFRALQTHLETRRAESAIKSVSLRVHPVQAGQKQLGLFETVLADPQQFQETLARLVAVLGPDRVGSPALEDSHRPDAFRLVAPDFENAPPVLRAQPPDRAAVSIRRFRPPIRAEVESAAGTHAPLSLSARPLSIRCAVANGRLRILLGPWRASGQWWDPVAWEREEWDAATRDGQVIRLVHQPDGWFVEGVID